jgi:hypothetical protein
MTKVTKNRAKTLCISVLLVFISSCSTTSKRAKSALESENYDEAIDLYGQILADDVSNTDATAGLHAAQQGFLGKKLIQTRMARLAENWPDSLSLLSLAITKEKAWKTAPSGNVAFTQEEETGYAIGYTRRFVSATVQAHHPLAAEDFFSAYKVIFDDRNDDSIQASKNEIQTGGTAECKSLRKMRGAKTPHFDLMVSQFCLHYGLSEDNQKLLDNSEKSVRTTLIAAIQLNFAKNSFADVAQTQLQDALRGSFQRTAWYDPKGSQLLVLNVSGSFSENHTKNPVVLEQDYQEAEQYVEQVSVTKTRDVSYMDTQTTIDPLTGQPQTSTVPRVRQETYQDWEPQERTRYITKSYRYPAWKHEQALSLTTEMTGSLADAPLQFSLTDAAHADGIEHDENQPSMGLSPSRPKLLDPNQWEKDEFLKLAPQLATRASALWRDHFCGDFTGKSSAETGEKVLLCLRQSDQPMPAAADQWASNEFGIKAIRIQEVLGRE